MKWLTRSKARKAPSNLHEFYEEERESSRRQSEINEEAIKVRPPTRPLMHHRRQCSPTHDSYERSRCLLLQALFHDPRAKKLDPSCHPRPDLEPNLEVIELA